MDNLPTPETQGPQSNAPISFLIDLTLSVLKTPGVSPFSSAEVVYWALDLLKHQTVSQIKQDGEENADVAEHLRYLEQIQEIQNSLFVQVCELSEKFSAAELYRKS